jgi:hypothetical protein
MTHDGSAGRPGDRPDRICRADARTTKTHFGERVQTAPENCLLPATPLRDPGKDETRGVVIARGVWGRDLLVGAAQMDDVGVQPNRSLEFIRRSTLMCAGSAPASDRGVWLGRITADASPCGAKSRTPTYSIDEQQVSSEMALGEAAPLLSRLAEPVLAEG